MDNKIPTIDFNSCTFKDKFTLGNCTIGSFLVKKCLFEDKFEFKSNKVAKCEIVDTNFHALVNFYETKFGEFTIHKSIFEDFVIFEKATFVQVPKTRLLDLSMLHS